MSVRCSRDAARHPRDLESSFRRLSTGYLAVCHRAFVAEIERTVDKPTGGVDGHPAGYLVGLRVKGDHVEPPLGARLGVP